jgi:hypothetical protein
MDPEFTRAWQPSLDEIPAAVNGSNIPVPHRLSTLRSPAAMHNNAGQRPPEIRCEY